MLVADHFTVTLPALPGRPKVLVLLTLPTLTRSEVFGLTHGVLARFRDDENQTLDGGCGSRSDDSAREEHCGAVVNKGREAHDFMSAIRG